MPRYAVLVVSLTLLTGCVTSFMSQTPQNVQAALPVPPPAAYTRARTAFVAMGGIVQLEDVQARTFVGVVHNAVRMSVGVDERSVVYATCQLLPGKIALGQFTECQDYSARLQQQGQAYAR